MATINISLPDKLREQANKLIKDGYYSSFSDLTRTAIRGIILDRYYDLLIKEANQTRRGKHGISLTTNQEIGDFIKSEWISTTPHFDSIRSGEKRSGRFR